MDLIAALTAIAQLFENSGHYGPNRPDLHNAQGLKQDVANFKDDKAVLVLRDEDGKIVAAAIGFGIPESRSMFGGHRPARFWLQHIVVDERLLGQGLGAQMIRAIIMNIPTTYKTLEFGVRNSNTGMLAFSEKQGFGVYQTKQHAEYGIVSYLRRDISEEPRLQPFSGPEVLFHVKKEEDATAA